MKRIYDFEKQVFSEKTGDAKFENVSFSNIDPKIFAPFGGDFNKFWSFAKRMSSFLDFCYNFKQQLPYLFSSG